MVWDYDLRILCVVHCLEASISQYVREHKIELNLALEVDIVSRREVSEPLII